MVLLTLLKPTHIIALWSKTAKKHRKSSHLIIHFPISEGVSKVSE